MALDVRFLVERPSSAWLSLNDGDTFRLEAEALNEVRRSSRRQEVTNAYVNGTFLIHSVIDNVTENVSALVYGTDHLVLEAALQAAIQAFEQPSYRVYCEIDGLCQVWTCFAASEITVSTQKEFRHSRLAKITFQVPRLPDVTYVSDASYITQEAS